MTQYRTNNPLGSMAPRDLFDNAQNVDNWSNGAEPFYEDRFGVMRRSFSGMNFEFEAAQTGRQAAFDQSQADKESRFQVFLVSSGYVSKGDYAANVVLEERNEYVAVDAATTGTTAGLYRPNASATLPLTLTGTWATDAANLVLLGDDVLRQELGGGIRRFSAISNLRSSGGRFDGDIAVLTGYYDDTPGVGGGMFRWDAQSTAADNDGTVIAAAGPSIGRWTRIFSGRLPIDAFGIRPETAGAGAQIQSALNIVKHIFIPEGIYYDCKIEMPAGSSIVGAGKNSVLRYYDPQSFGEGSPIMVRTDGCFVDNVMCDGNWDGVSDLAPHISMNFEGLNGKRSSNLRIGTIWVRNCSGDAIDFDGCQGADVGTVYAEGVGGSCVHPSYHEGTDTFAADIRVGKIVANGCGLFNNRQCLNVFGFDPQGGSKRVTVGEIYATDCYGLVGCSANTEDVYVGRAIGFNIGPLAGRECAQVVLNSRSRIDTLYMRLAIEGVSGSFIRFSGPDCSIGTAVIRDATRAANSLFRTDADATRAHVNLLRATFDNSFGSGEGIGIYLRGTYGTIKKAIIENAASNGARIISHHCEVNIDTINCGQGVGFGAGSPQRAGVWLAAEVGFQCRDNRITTTANDNQGTPTQQYGVYEDDTVNGSSIIESGVYSGMAVGDERLSASNRYNGVGAVAMLAKTTAGALTIGQSVSGSDLAPSNTSGSLIGSAPAGRWVALNAVGGTGSPAADRVGLFRRIR